MSLSGADHVSSQCRLVHSPTLVWQSCGECSHRCSAPLMLPPLVDGAGFSKFCWIPLKSMDQLNWIPAASFNATEK